MVHVFYFLNNKLLYSLNNSLSIHASVQFKINVNLYRDHIIFIIFKPNSKYFLSVHTKVAVYM